MTLDIYRNGAVNLSKKIDDRTQLIKELFGKSIIHSTIYSNVTLDINIGDYVLYSGVKYILNDLPEVTKISSNALEYRLVFENEFYNLTGVQFLDNGNNEFSLCGTAETFIDLIITNLDRVYGSGTWTKGTVKDTDYQTLEISNETCLSILQLMNTKFTGEFYFSGGNGRTINFETNSGSNTTPLWYSDWEYRQKITIDKDKVSTTTQLNFPVLITEDNLNDEFWLHVNNNGSDIVVTSDDYTTKLSRELVSIDVSNKTLELWVKVPSLSNATDTIIYLYYGKSTASETNSTAVWDSNYKFVSHMEDNPDTSHINDSTSNANDGDKKGANEPIEISSGKIKEAQDFDGTDDYIEVSNDPDIHFDGEDFTISMWVRPDITNSDVYQVGGWGGPKECRILVQNSKFKITLLGTVSTIFDNFVSDTLTLGNWYYITMTRSGSDFNWYLNGVFVSNFVDSAQDLIDSGTALQFGKGDYWLNGAIDDTQISKGVARSTGWILTSYNNQNSPSTFYSVGIEESKPEALVLKYRYGLKSITRTRSNSSNIITRLYVYGSTVNLPTDYRNGATRLRFEVGGNNYIEQNTDLYGIKETLIVYDDIYPHRTGTISGIDNNNVLIFYDSSMEFNLNDYLLPGITAKVHIQTGALAGYEFEVSAYDTALTKFTIIKISDNQGTDFPNDSLKLAVGDKYVIVDIFLPQSYIDTAEQLLYNRSIVDIDKLSSPKMTYSVVVDWKYFRDNDISLLVGDYITIVDTQLNVSKVIRIIGLSQSIYNEYKYSLTLSDEVIMSTAVTLKNDITTTNRGLYKNTDLLHQITGGMIRVEGKNVKLNGDTIVSGDFTVKGVINAGDTIQLNNDGFLSPSQLQLGNEVGNLILIDEDGDIYFKYAGENKLQILAHSALPAISQIVDSWGSLQLISNGIELLGTSAIGTQAVPKNFTVYQGIICYPSAAPGTPAEGQIYYDSGTNKLKVYNGSAWETVTSSV